MPYQQITLTQLQTALADRYESVPFWTGPEATRAINEALRIWNAATGFWAKAFTTITVPDDPYVAVTGSLVRAARVSYNGVPLEKASLDDFNYGIPNWRGVTTASGGTVPTRPVYWAPVSLTLLAIYPADHAGFGALVIDGVRATPILVNAGDYIDLGQEEHDTLLGYALHVLAFKLGGQTLVRTYPGWLAFLRAAAARNAQFAESAFYKAAMGGDGLQRRRVPQPMGTSPLEQVIAQEGPS